MITKENTRTVRLEPFLHWCIKVRATEQSTVSNTPERSRVTQCSSAYTLNGSHFVKIDFVKFLNKL